MRSGALYEPLKIAVVKRWGLRLHGQQVLGAGMMALLLFLICVRLGIMLWASLNPSWIFDGKLDITLANYADLLSEPLLFHALLNTFVYGLIASVLGAVLGAVFAWLLERTDLPFNGRVGLVHG